MRFLKLFIILFITFFLNSAANAYEDVPSLDEYNNVKKGLLLPEQSVEENDVFHENVRDKHKKAMTLEEIRTAYKDGEYDKIIDSVVPQAKNGLHPAEELLGLMYKYGQGVKKDPKKAFIWLEKAAEAGQALSQHHLGIMYYTGEGVRQNIVKSLVWLKIATLYYEEGTGKTQAETDFNSVFKKVSRREKTRYKEIIQEWLVQKGELHRLQ